MKVFTEGGKKLVQYVDRVSAEEPGIEVSAQYNDIGSVRLEIIKDGIVVAGAILGRWQWERLQTQEVEL